MAAKDDNAPVIIKKKKKGGGHGHHGGAWKVAYADFVTAMMAFFLLMWLINATTEDQKTGIADYFSPTTVSQATSGGGGMLSGQTLSTDGALVDDRAPVAMRVESTAPPSPDSDDRTAEDESADFDSAAQTIEGALEREPALTDLADNLEVEQTLEGLHIQLVDREGESMFASGRAEPMPRTLELLDLISEAIGDLPNAISIKGHTDSTPFAGDNDYGNWELSTDRANASRRVLERAGVASDRIAEVVGRADQDLLLPDDPENPRNRRISILLLRETPLPANGAPTGGAPERESAAPATEPALPATPTPEPQPQPEAEPLPTGPSILGRD